MKTITTLLLVVICKLIFAQDTTAIYLHSWKDSSKVYRMKLRKNISVFLNEQDSACYGRVQLSFSGFLEKANKNYISISTNYVNMQIKSSNGKQHINSYFDDFDRTHFSNKPPKTIATNDINSINQIQSDNSYKILFGTILTGLVVAPLASINYRTGNFNEKIYYPILISSAVAFGITWIISSGNESNKTFHIKQSKPADDKDYYWITTEKSKYLKKMPKEKVKKTIVAF